LRKQLQIANCKLQIEEEDCQPRGKVLGAREEKEAAWHMSTTRTIDLPDLAATQAFGRQLGRLLFPGAVVALVGPLGAGKTHLVRATALGLGIPDSRLVTSPTFVLIQEYPGRLPIYHFDAYRLAGAAAFSDLGVSEYLEGEGVCLIEWADRVEACLPEEYLRITLRITGETAREAVLETCGKRYGQVVMGL
jgi:tRNA threonylcarbamoyladenosine biosynthesis protein TsaE